MASPGPSRETWIAIVLVIAAIVLIPMILFVGFGAGGGMMGGGAGMGTSWGAIIGLLVVVGVVGLLYTLIVPGQAQPVIPPPYPHPEWGTPPPGMTSLQILDARYARGELSREDYLRMRQDLEGPKP